jgi:hypothetical protein
MGDDATILFWKRDASKGRAWSSAGKEAGRPGIYPTFAIIHSGGNVFSTRLKAQSDCQTAVSAASDAVADWTSQQVYM